jgi:uncharacterized membrane protein
MARQTLNQVGSKVVIGAFLVSGTFHLIAPAQFMPLLPDWTPYPLVLVYLSGIAELLAAIGLIAKLRWAPIFTALVLLVAATSSIATYLLGTEVTCQKRLALYRRAGQRLDSHRWLSATTCTQSQSSARKGSRLRKLPGVRSDRPLRTFPARFAQGSWTLGIRSMCPVHTRQPITR